MSFSLSNFIFLLLLGLTCPGSLGVLAAPPPMPRVETRAVLTETDGHDQISNLTKRSGRPPPTKYPLFYIQQQGRSLIPTVEFWPTHGEMKTDLISQSTCLFYTKIPGMNVPQAQTAILNWYNQHIKCRDTDPITGQPPRKGITANMSVDSSRMAWIMGLVKSIDYCNVRNIFHDTASGLDISTSASADGTFSQAFSEACTGVVYWFSDFGISSLNPPVRSVWTKYELPALRNSGKITAIARVIGLDRGIAYLDLEDTVLIHPQVIWSPGDPDSKITAPSNPNPDGFRFFNGANPYAANGGDSRCLHQ